MVNVTRERHCIYYMPWIATFCSCILVAALGVWIKWTMDSKSSSEDGLTALDVSVPDLSKVQAALTATAIIYLVFAIILFSLSFWRSFVEAGHDATGLTTGSATAFMVVAAIVNTLWFALLLWLVLLIMADTFWLGLVWVGRKAINNSIDLSAKYGSATWLPSDGVQCPGQCLDLSAFAYIDVDTQNACVCSVAKMKASLSHLDDSYGSLPGVVVGIWIMFVAALCLLINFACQFAHTKRERETLHRIAAKSYNAYG